MCASANPGKVSELRAILGDAIELLPRPAGLPDVIEDSGTLVGNARVKAVATASHSGRPALADDTGLEVHALDGRPGVETASYAGEGATDEENRTKLLAELASLGPTVDRRARFRTIVMIAWPDGTDVWAEGVCDGTIATEPRGIEGFGYDSVFVPAQGDGRSFAEMTADEKHGLSHRGRALTALLSRLAGTGRRERAPS